MLGPVSVSRSNLCTRHGVDPLVRFCLLMVVLVVVVNEGGGERREGRKEGRSLSIVVDVLWLDRGRGDGGISDVILRFLLLPLLIG